MYTLTLNICAGKNTRFLIHGFFEYHVNAALPLLHVSHDALRRTRRTHSKLWRKIRI